MKYNKDYFRGLIKLVRYSKKHNVNIRIARWIPNLLYHLSEKDACEKFVDNVIRFKNLYKLMSCKKFSDIFHRSAYEVVFIWNNTHEGFEYWHDIDYSLLFNTYQSTNLSEEL